jgi:hypothetical protein
MSFYERETWLKNSLDALFKPIIGKIYDTNAPGYRRNDISNCGNAGFTDIRIVEAGFLDDQTPSIFKVWSENMLKGSNPCHLASCLVQKQSAPTTYERWELKRYESEHCSQLQGWLREAAREDKS